MIYLLVLKLLFLILATICLFLLILSLAKGKAFVAMVENLDSEMYFMKDWYTIGFYLNSTKLFRLRGKLESDMKTQAKLVFGNVYYEYYATLAWAQFLTFALVICSVGLTAASLAGLEGGVFFLVVTGFAVAIAWYMCVAKMKETVTTRREACEEEFPNMVSKLCLLINSGMTLHEAWVYVSYSKEGMLYDMMRSSCQDMNNGDSDRDAIYKFGILTDSSDIKKFTGNIISSIEKGPKELSNMLMAQTTELWAHKRQVSLQKGEIAAGKLIVPLGITFAGIILIVVSGAMQSMQF